MNVREAVFMAAASLAREPELAGYARRDAEALLRHTLSLGPAGVRARPERELTSDEQIAFDAFVVRRLAHEPIQYIVGQQEFYGLGLRVSPAVLIPRPQTEHLVEAILGWVPNDRSLQILDVGTGSGAIAIALAMYLPEAEVTAVDLSPLALEVAGHNARTHGVAGRVRMVVSDLLRAVDGAKFDVIVSNPPYIPEGDRGSLHPQVREHEPSLALFAGTDGLAIYRRLIPQAHEALVPGGLLALEIGYGQRTAVGALLDEWAGVTFHDDLQGIPRVALAPRGPLDQGSLR